MSIRDAQKFVDTLWDWACLRGCFGATRIEPTDIDGWVERNGRFLYLETKLPGNDLTRGQSIAFENRVSDGRSTVIVVWGQPGKPQAIRLITSKRDRFIDAADLEKLREVVRQWFEFADRRPWVGIVTPGETVEAGAFADGEVFEEPDEASPEVIDECDGIAEEVCVGWRDTGQGFIEL